MAQGTDGRLKIKLGTHEYVALPQKIGYLQHRLGPRLQELAELAAEEGDGGASIVGRQAYELLSALIPEGFMPEHEFMGFATADAYGAGKYDPDLDDSPTVPEVLDALKGIAKVNGGDAVDFLRKLLGPELVGKLLSLAIASWAERGKKDKRDEPGDSPSSPPPNGASAQTSSGINAPTLPAGA